MESFFAFSCVLFGCTHSSPPSLVTWQGAGPVLRRVFAGSLGCIRDLRTQYPSIKIKYCASNDLLMEQSHTSQSAWASQIATLAKSLSCILHRPSHPQLLTPPLNMVLSVASVFSKCLCVCENAGFGQRPFVFKVYFRVVVS